jgi:hypothetical protein
MAKQATAEKFAEVVHGLGSFNRGIEIRDAVDLQARISLFQAALDLGTDVLGDETAAKNALADPVRSFWNQAVVAGFKDTARHGLTRLGLIHLAEVH